MVSWVVETSREQLNRQIRERDIENMMTVNAMNLHFGYRISEKSHSWSPEMAFDDGQKTYLKMKTKAHNSPAASTGEIAERLKNAQDGEFSFTVWNDAS